MLNVYLVSRTDDIDWDEYDSCVVIAENEEEAFKLADKNYYVFKRDKVEIEKLNLNESKAVLGSFNAG